LQRPKVAKMGMPNLSKMGLPNVSKVASISTPSGVVKAGANILKKQITKGLEM
jgi:hypothetical protein